MVNTPAYPKEYLDRLLNVDLTNNYLIQYPNMTSAHILLSAYNPLMEPKGGIKKFKTDFTPPIEQLIMVPFLLSNSNDPVGIYKRVYFVFILSRQLIKPLQDDLIYKVIS